MQSQEKNRYVGLKVYHLEVLNYDDKQILLNLESLHQTIIAIGEKYRNKEKRDRRELNEVV
jgi:predicted proteasome-type protease